MKSIFRIFLFILPGIVLSGFASCSGNDAIPVSPALNAPTRVMLKETVNVSVTGIPDGSEVIVDFGDGTILSAVSPAPVRHPYSESGDYDITVKAGSSEFSKTIRVYSLLALSEAQKQFRDPDNRTVWVMTHRAHTTDYSIPENSVSAVAAAIASGAEAIELDTHRTKDGHIVVCHDQTIDRTTNGTGDITQMTLAEIQEYNLKDRNGQVTDEKMPTLEEFKLTKPREKNVAKSSRKDIKKEDTTTVFTITAEPETVEQYGFLIEFKFPLVESAFDSLEFRYLNPKQQEFTDTYTVVQDSLNLRKYVVRPTSKLLPGYEYFLKVPHHKFKDINGFYNDSSEVKVTLPNDDKLSSLTLTLSNVDNKYIIDLLNEKRDKTIRSFTIEQDATLLFPYITAGKYSIRITEDLNRNGLVDTGNLLEHKQPEKVKFYKLDDGNTLIDIPEMTELEQSIDVGELFK